MVKTDIDVLARTLWGEARGEGREGMTAVANVVMNRVNSKRWPGTVAEVCQQPFQFSCWLSSDPNRSKLMAVTEDDSAFKIALEIAKYAVEEELFDITKGANHYHAWSVSPSWAKGVNPVVYIGSHIFYKL